MLEQRSVIWTGSLSCQAQRCSQDTSSAESFTVIMTHPGSLKEPITELQEELGAKSERAGVWGCITGQRNTSLWGLPFQSQYPHAHPPLSLLPLTGLLTFYSTAGLLQRLLCIVPARSPRITASHVTASICFHWCFIFTVFLNSESEERVKPSAVP